MESVSILLEQAGINPQIKNNEGQTPLDIAKTDEVGSLLAQFMSSGLEAEEDED